MAAPGGEEKKVQFDMNGQPIPEPEKKKRGKPKDENAPPKPKSGYQAFAGPCRTKLKEERPALCSDLKGMGIAIAEEWGKVPEEEKARLQAIYEKEMVVWKPLWADYKQTPGYKEFFEIKQDWIDRRGFKKLQKTMTKDAPKRPKSGYMIFAGEVREDVMKEVAEKGLGMGDGGRLISERWQAISEAQKARYGEMSAEQKKVFEPEFAKYRIGDSYRDYMDARAKMEANQGLKKITRVCLGTAPKKAQSAYALYRAEVMPAITAENDTKKEGEKLAMGDIARKVSGMWAEVTEVAKKPYAAKAEIFRQQYLKDYQGFKVGQKYDEFLAKREKIKTRQNRLLGLRDMPKRPKSVFAMFADENKDKVPPGKGEGKGRSALKVLFTDIEAEKKKEYEAKEAELKEKWLKDVQEYKEGDRYKTFLLTVTKIRQEFSNEAIKVTTMKFLNASPAPPPRSAFALFLNEKRKKTEEADGAPSAKQSKEEKSAEMTAAKKDWNALDKALKAEYEVRRKDAMKDFEEECKQYMQTEKWQEYIKETKRMRIPIKSLLFHKKKVVKKLAKGEKMQPSAIPLPDRPGSFPTKPKAAQQNFIREKKGQPLDEIMKMWTDMEAEEKQKYVKEAAEEMRQFDTDMKEFKDSEEGKKFVRDVKICQRRRRILAAKNKYLDELPKKPDGAIKFWQISKLPEVKKGNPGKKGFEIKKILEETWTNLSDADRQKVTDESKERFAEFEEAMRAFKESDNWKNFQKAVKVPGKAGGGGGPKAPESMPKKPIGAYMAFCKTQTGSGKGLAELAKVWQELDKEKKDEFANAAKAEETKFRTDMAEWKKTLEAKTYFKRKESSAKAKRMSDAKKRFLKDMPKKPLTAYFLFTNEKRPEISKDFPDLKGLGPVQGKLAELWKGLNEEDKKVWTDKEKEATKAYQETMSEYKATPDYKKYEAIARSCAGAGKPKAKGKAAKKTFDVGPKTPENLPKKPPSAMILYGNELRKEGKGANLSEMSKAWTGLGKEGQKPYIDQSREMQRAYEKDTIEFNKTAEGKKYIREKAASGKKLRLKQAKNRLLGTKDVPAEPKRPMSGYFIFISEKRSTVTGSMGEVSKEMTKQWNDPGNKEMKVEYENKAKELKKKFDEAMREYNENPHVKAYKKQIQMINGSEVKKNIVKAKAKAKASKGAGRGKPAADSDSDSDAPKKNSSDSDSDSDAPKKPVAKKKAAAKKPAAKKAAAKKAADSDSDVMGDDSDKDSDSSSNASNSD